MPLKIGIPVGMGKTQFQINKAYINYVGNAKYEPVMLNPLNDMPSMAKICDGLLLPGGIDIDPVFYREDNAVSYGVNPAKDDFERKCFYAFVAESKPIFGICRGFQLIAREFLWRKLHGWDYLKYWQHIKDHRNTSELDVARDVRTHSVQQRADLLYGAKSSGPIADFVNSIHHQGLVMRVPKAENFLQPYRQFVPLALTKMGLPTKQTGYVVEAYSIKGWNKAPIRAVQWHPEELNDVALLRYFFENNKQGGSNYVAKQTMPKVENKDEKHEDPKVQNNSQKG